MKATSQQHRIDPIRVFMETQVARRSSRPIPLISTNFDVVIDAGLAIVTTTRVFRNEEKDSIEVTITFPVPIHATLFDLRAKIGNRSLVAKASRKEAARTTYEGAIERGKAAVLHEEVLRGVHMLSVAHVPPGEEIEVITTWVTTLTIIATEGHLRVPLTVGDVYGRSPLSDADDLTGGGEPLIGALNVTCVDASVRLIGGFLENGKARVEMNRPIDLVVGQWRSRAHKSIAADGRSVSLLLEPAPSVAAALSVAVLVDHSGSMGDPVIAGPRTRSKYAVVVTALRALAKLLKGSDMIDLWEFDNSPRQIGSTGDSPPGVEKISRRSNGQKLRALVDRLSAPAGGTEIGDALTAAIGQSNARDILVITDGKSHALDIQTLACKGSRISVILIGEDSLEANVGHLAALTGGDIFVSGGADIAELFHSALEALRGNSGQVTREDTETAARIFQRAGLMATLSFGSSGENSAQDKLARGVAALAASFLLPTLDETAAAELAEREGILSHLTSLVLVDEAGPSQSGLPSQRKVPLPVPVVAWAIRDDMGAKYRVLPMPEPSSSTIGKQQNSNRNLRGFLRRYAVDVQSPSRQSIASIDELAQTIDWGSDPSRLLIGDVSEHAEEVQLNLKALAEIDDIMTAAQKLQITPLILVIALIGRVAGIAGDRSAKRIALTILKGLNTEQLDDLLLVLRRST